MTHPWHRVASITDSRNREVETMDMQTVSDHNHRIARSRPDRQRHRSGRHQRSRRFPRRRLRRFLFFALLIGASLAAGYLISRYEPRTSSSE